MAKTTCFLMEGRGNEGGARLRLFIARFAAKPEGPAGKLAVDVEESIKRMKTTGFLGFGVTASWK